MAPVKAPSRGRTARSRPRIPQGGAVEVDQGAWARGEPPCTAWRSAPCRPRSPQNQHVQLGACHHVYLVAQPGHGGECPIISGCSGPFRVPGTRGSLLWRASRPAAGRCRGRRRPEPHQPQLLVADAVELGRVHAVYGQGADQRLIREERQADAGVYLEVVVIRQQAVIGVGQGAVGGKRTTSPARAMARGAGDPLRAKRRPASSCIRPSMASGMNWPS